MMVLKKAQGIWVFQCGDSNKKKPPSESDMELDLNMNKQPQSESDKDMNLEPLNISSTQTHSESETDLVDEGNLQPMTSKKRKRIDEASSLHEPQPKQQKNRI